MNTNLYVMCLICCEKFTILSLRTAHDDMGVENHVIREDGVAKNVFYNLLRIAPDELYGTDCRDGGIDCCNFPGRATGEPIDPSE